MHLPARKSPVLVRAIRIWCTANSDNQSVVRGFRNSGTSGAFFKTDVNGVPLEANLDADGPLGSDDKAFPKHL